MLLMGVFLFGELQSCRWRGEQRQETERARAAENERRMWLWGSDLRRRQKAASRACARPPIRQCLALLLDRNSQSLSLSTVPCSRWWSTDF